MSNDKAHLSNDKLQSSKAKSMTNDKVQNPNKKRNKFWHLGIWILFDIWTLTFGFK
jgi:hypothetical protein